MAAPENNQRFESPQQFRRRKILTAVAVTGLLGGCTVTPMGVSGAEPCDVKANSAAHVVLKPGTGRVLTDADGSPSNDFLIAEGDGKIRVLGSTAPSGDSNDGIVVPPEKTLVFPEWGVTYTVVGHRTPGSHSTTLDITAQRGDCPPPTPTPTRRS